MITIPQTQKGRSSKKSKNYDDTLTGQLINYVENRDSVGYKDGRWYQPTKKGFDKNNFGMGVDKNKNPYIQDKFKKDLLGKTYITESDEKDARYKSMAAAEKSAEERYKYARSKIGSRKPISENKQAITNSAIYNLGQGFVARNLFENTKLMNSLFHGSDEEYNNMVNYYYKQKGRNERVKRTNEFLKLDNKEIPSYAFGIDKLNAISSAGQLLGGAIETFSPSRQKGLGMLQETTNGQIAGGTVKGAMSGLSTGASLGSIIPGLGTVVGGAAGAVIGGVGSYLGAKKQQEGLRKANQRIRTQRQTDAGLDMQAQLESEYYDDNGIAYTFANGGLNLGNLAYVDDNEILRDTSGELSQVPETNNGTDKHLIDASALESVLSDKLKVPGTKKTFAETMARYTNKPKSANKRSDRFSQGREAAEEIAHSLLYDDLLKQQEQLKIKKGITPKQKDIPAYVNGTSPDGEEEYWGEPLPEVSVNPSELLNPAQNHTIGRFLPEVQVTAERPKRWYEQLNRVHPRVSSYDPRVKDFSIPKPYHQVEPTEWLPGWKPVIPNATTQTTNLPSYLTGKLPRAREQGLSANIGQLPIGAPLGLPSSPQIQSIPTTAATKTALSSVKQPAVANTASRKPLQAESLSVPKPRLVTVPGDNTIWDVPKIDPKVASAQYNKMKQLYSPNPVDSGSSGFNLDNLLSLAPTLYNWIQGMQTPEQEALITNPYAGQIRRNMANRRFNIDPTIEANRTSRAIANYNANNINPNTGMNMALRTQLAADEYRNNATLFSQKQNADNQYVADYASTLNNLGGQYMQNRQYQEDINARNRAAARNYTGAAASQLGEWSQYQTQMGNQRRSDDMIMPFLSEFLSAGFTKEQLQKMLASYGG